MNYNTIKNFIGQLLTLILIFSIVTLAIGVFYMRESKIVGGVVLEHGIVSNGNGDRDYITIIKTGDGYIEEKEGLDLYVVPINQQVSIKVHRWKKVNFKL